MGGTSGERRKSDMGQLDELAWFLPERGSDRTAGSCLYALQREGYIRRIHSSERTGRLRMTEVKPKGIYLVIVGWYIDLLLNEWG